MTFLRSAAIVLVATTSIAVRAAAAAAADGPAVEPPAEPAVAHDAHEEEAREAMGSEPARDDADPDRAPQTDPDPDREPDPDERTTPRTDATHDATTRDPDARERAQNDRASLPPAGERPDASTIDPAMERAQLRWPVGATLRRRPRWMGARAYEYFTRPLDPSARHLDHGVLQVAAAGGVPHRYRLEVALGLFDHVSLGVTAHWLPRQQRPYVSPRIAVAFYRWWWVELGALHFWSMFPPPPIDFDPSTPSFQRRAQWILATATFSQRFLSAGIDAGAVRAREIDDSVMTTTGPENTSVVRWHFGGGLHLRAGTRRWGFTAQAHVPQLTAEIVFDVRFGLFELRPKGGWRPNEELRATDRRLPTRR